MTCLLCEDPASPQRIRIAGMWVWRALCTPCADWIRGSN